ncbi:glutamyl-tRNA reductase [Pontibacter sp. SGAir0037]|uniref:glutamyl-tRNA reductase n=1 Tax=Pontibacter sp. SGAir0037 TaxID=2571030 RepID=UPI0010CD4F14|nr:glutamyl-tRNA reductase [Pontibacter sp. SGAir0037]QCR21476.1 glutamyl-tRNA reductase [Pontibacter sp. SGAir0037]
MLKAVSLSHQTASLNWRQALQLQKEEAAAFMASLKIRGLAEGVLVITTCNRTEVYFESADTTPAQIQQELLQFKQLHKQPAYTNLFTHHNYSESTLQYLLEVGLGLRSQVIGDRQIIGQFKESYQHTKDLQFGSPLLHQAMQTLLRAHKRVHNETGFRSGASSVGYAALERIADFIPRKDFPAKKLLIIGAGQMGTDVAKYAASFGFKAIAVANRTDAKAAELAEKLQLEHLPYSQYLAALPSFDVVISCVSGGEQIKPEQLGTTSNRRIVLDLSVPQSIAPAVAQLAHTTLINIDQITSRTQAVKAARMQAIADVEQIIEEETEQFAQWLEELPVAKSVAQLKSFFASVLETELAKHPQLQQEDTASKLAKAALDRLIRRPAGALKTTTGASRQVLLDSLQTLFKLD